MFSVEQDTIMYATILSVVLLAVACQAQVPHLGACPKVTVVDNLDVSKYLGDWYEIQKFRFLIEAGESCIKANYSLKADGHIQVLNKGLKSDGTVDVATGDAVPADPSVPAKLLVEFNGSPRVPYWVVDTDYTTYSLVWSCTDLGGLVQADFAWLLSRTRTLDQATIDKATQKLASFGVDTSSFMVTKQDDSCNF